MKKLTLNQTWTLCLRMWKWIASVWKEGDDVDTLKDQWLEENGFETIIQSCFFCDWANRGYDELRFSRCVDCPGKKVDKAFNCLDITYHYYEDPKAFYAELLRLNRIRKATKSTEALDG